MAPSHSHSTNEPSRGSTSDDDTHQDPLSITSNKDLVLLVRKLEAEKNQAIADVTTLRRRLDPDIEDEDALPSKRRRTQSPPPCTQPRNFCGDQNRDDDGLGEQEEEDSDEHLKSDDDESDDSPAQMGHKFFLIYGPWLRMGKSLFRVDVDEEYDEVERFENVDNLAQGQLHEVLEIVQDKYMEGVLKQKWFTKSFFDGFNTQRYNTANRLRHNCAGIFGVEQVDLLSPSARNIKFRERIGWTTNEHGVGTYSSVDVEVLHTNYTGGFKLVSAFRNPILMAIYVALIRGPTAGLMFMKGERVYPHCDNMAKIHGIRQITPGAIATASILARWALSADQTLNEVGGATGIHYLEDYERYLEILMTGLRKKKKSVVATVKEWNERIFPDSSLGQDGPHSKEKDDGYQRALAQLEDDEDDSETAVGDSAGIAAQD